MAKMKMDMACAPSNCGPKCIILGLVSALISAAGLWLIIGGVRFEWAGLPWSSSLLWYFGGLVLWGIGRCTKMKACGMCAR